MSENEAQVNSQSSGDSSCSVVKQTRNEIDFLFELRVLLDRYDVDIVAVDDEEPYGMAQPLIELQFNRPYSTYQFPSITSADELEDDADLKFKTAG